ncbi:hypothetical protein [Oscillibacter valericigenes]|uniref:hypothetical protein n=1 Tax=Oscillibacter valericigenes TaxID=351091 RepID=UPI0019575DAF|nr:hypothetical protein [Oscillibacter valericigenes]MBM6910648.1 hypothetical protein [Oscillibacter valericigenes]
MDEMMRKEELVRAMTAIKLEPAVVESKITAGKYNRLPLSRLTALGTGLEPITAAVQQLMSHGQAVSGYYKVTIPPGTQLAQFKDGSGYLGSVIGSHGVQGQARMSPLMCNPTMLFVAATLFSIDQKLGSIQETQREMLDFMIQEKKSEMKGDLDFLIDVFNHYKYNWNDEKYKTANHVKVLDIRQEAGRKVDFYREQIKGNLGKRSLLNSDQEVRR